MVLFCAEYVSFEVYMIWDGRRVNAMRQRVLQFAVLMLCSASLWAQNRDSAYVEEGFARIIRLKNNDPDGAMKLNDTLRAMAQKLGNARLIGQSWLSRGTIYDDKGAFDMALVCYDSAMAVFKKGGISKGIANTCNNYGLVYNKLGKLDKSLMNHMEALKYRRAAKDTPAMSGSLGNIGLVHYSLKNYATSATYIQQCIDYKMAMKDGPMKLGRWYNSLANVYNDWGKKDTAIKYYLRAKALSEEVGDEANLTFLYTNIGSYYLEAKNYQLALAYMLRANKLLAGRDDLYSLAINVSGMAVALNNMKRYGEAKKYAEQVLQLADSIKSFEYIYRAHEALAISNTGLGNKEDAIHHTISALLFKDSLYNEQTAEATAAMETKYKTELKEEQIKLLSQENEIRQLTINAGKASLANTRYVVALLVLGIVIAMAIFYIRMQRLRTKQQLQLAEEREQYQKEGITAVIQAQEQERERIARELHDNICQQLSVVRLRLQQTEAGASQSAAMLDEITNEVRDLAYQMLPVTLQQYGLAPALNELVRHSFESTNIEAVFEDMTGNVDIPDSYILALYRVAQELVSNALKHSNASLINIQLLIIKNILVLTVEDNGKGLKDEHAKRGMGMVNIRTRVEQIGGEIVIENNRSGGLRTVIKVPLKNRV